jgi:hypothetical protein
MMYSLKKPNSEFANSQEILFLEKVAGGGRKTGISESGGITTSSDLRIEGDNSAPQWAHRSCAAGVRWEQRQHKHSRSTRRLPPTAPPAGLRGADVRGAGAHRSFDLTATESRVARR